MDCACGSTNFNQHSETSSSRQTLRVLTYYACQRCGRVGGERLSLNGQHIATGSAARQAFFTSPEQRSFTETCDALSLCKSPSIEHIDIKRALWRPFKRWMFHIGDYYIDLFVLIIFEEGGQCEITIPALDITLTTNAHAHQEILHRFALLQPTTKESIRIAQTCGYPKAPWISIKHHNDLFTIQNDSKATDPMTDRRDNNAVSGDFVAYFERLNTDKGPGNQLSLF